MAGPELPPQTDPAKVEPNKDTTTPGQHDDGDNSLQALETDMLEQSQEKMQSLEEEFVKDLVEKKRKQEHDLQAEMDAKRKKLNDEILALEEEKCLQESRLALASDQLQERMQLVSDEQQALDELKEKSKAVRDQLEAAGIEKQQDDAKRAAAEKKELLKQKLEATIHRSKAGVPLVPSTPPETPNPAAPLQSPAPTVPAEMPEAPTPTEPVAERNLVPVSEQRFTSSTHPQAWHCLYRMTRKTDGCNAEIYKLWHEGWGVTWFTFHFRHAST